MGEADRAPFRIGDHFVEPRRNLLIGPAGPASLQPKMMDLLCYLADRHGEVVSRSELIDRVWGVEYGADESLTRAISQLRKAFGDSRETPRIIETIAKRGYRLVPSPLPGAHDGTAPNGLQPTTKRRARVIGAAILAAALVAILLWLGLGKSEEVALVSERTGIVLVVGPIEGSGARAFAEGFSAEIAKSPLVRVRAAGKESSGTATMYEYRLRGGIRRNGGFLEVNARLFDPSGEIVWSGTYRPAEVSAQSVQKDAANLISAEILPPLLSSVKAQLLRRPILSLEPWALTLLVTWVPGDEVRPTGPPSEESYWLQKRALELDPDFAPGHVLFAELAAYHALFHPPADTPAAHQRALRHAGRAIELAPYDAEVLYQLGLYYRFAGDKARSQAVLGRVLELQPNHPLARLDLAFVQGQCSEEADTAIREIEKAAARLSASNPVRWVALSHLANLHLSRGDYLAARDLARRSRQIVPITSTAMTLAAAEAALGRNDAALAVLAEHRREWPQLDVDYFAAKIVPRWCLGGSRTAAVQQSFRKLAASVPTN